MGKQLPTESRAAPPKCMPNVNLLPRKASNAIAVRRPAERQKFAKGDTHSAASQLQLTAAARINGATALGSIDLALRCALQGQSDRPRYLCSQVPAR